MMLLGLDIGTSSIKASLVEAKSGVQIASANSPEQEMAMNAPQPGWAEQDPEMWWKNVKCAAGKILSESKVNSDEIAAVGISYQMHGLIIVGQNHDILRPAIIWSDGRAVEIGEKAYRELGEDYCRQHFLNSPGNFTASKLRWVKENEPEIYNQIYKFMLPGDYIGMKLTGEIMSSVSGLSEAILWDYQKYGLSQKLLDYYEIDEALVPRSTLNFSEQGQISKEAASELGLKAGIPVTYRAGDQSNNALSLNVLNPGEVAATAGTSGVIYGVTDEPLYDELSRVNTFIHVNHQKNRERYGILLCINGTGIQYSWLKSKLFSNQYSYSQMNERAAEIPVGSEGICVLPFGNGPERVLRNRDIGAHIQHIDFNRHGKTHLMRATQEGIAFSLNYGLQIMKQMGLSINTIRVGSANMFQSPVFRETFTNITGTTVELYETNGALGAAIGAGLGAEIFSSREEAFQHLKQIAVLQPEVHKRQAYQEAYEKWEKILRRELSDAK
jgi:xylulokinase